MIKEKSGVSATQTIKKGLDKNLWYQKNKDAFNANWSKKKSLL